MFPFARNTCLCMVYELYTIKLFKILQNNFLNCGTELICRLIVVHLAT